MRKLFRMKHESCTGQCYEYDGVAKIKGLGLDIMGAAAFLRRLIALHEPSCGNSQIGFSLDVDDEREVPVYVASMQRYGALDLWIGDSSREALDKLIDGALAWYASDEGKRLLQEQPGVGHDACHHGDDRALVEFAIAHSGLAAPDQAALRAQFA
jgi:hypothetical protein